MSKYLRGIKQQTKEKLGIANVSTKESADFTQGKTQLKELKHHIEILQKSAHQVTQLSSKHYKAQKAFWGSFDSMVLSLDNTGFNKVSNSHLVASLKLLSTLLHDIDSNVHTHLQRLTPELENPIQAMLKNDFDNYSRTKKKYYKARTDYDAARDYKQGLQKKTMSLDPAKIKSATTDEKIKKKVWTSQRIAVMAQMMDIEARKEYYLLNTVIHLARSYQSLYSHSYALFYRSRIPIQQIGSYVSLQRKIFLKRLAARQAMATDIMQYRVLHKSSNFLDILLSPDLALVTAMISSLPGGPAKDNFLPNLLRLYDTCGVLSDVLKAAINSEVGSTCIFFYHFISLAQASTLFRGNSVSTKLMSAFTKLFGAQYLKDTLTSLVTEVIESDEHFEVDPKKLSDGDDPEANMESLKKMVNHFLNALIASKDIAPPPFRIVCYSLKKAVNDKFPDVDDSIPIGGFVFLRFFCAALFSPASFGVIAKPPPKPAQRALILITKVLQNLANGVTFNVKNAHLAPLNVFIEDNLDRVRNFFRAMAVLKNPDSITWEPLSSTEECTTKILPEMINNVKNNLNSVQKSLFDYKFGDRFGPVTMSICRAIDFGHEDDAEESTSTA